MAPSPDSPQGAIGSDLLREDSSFEDIVAQFVSGLSDRVARMDDAVRAADFEALRVAAHQLKGCGGGYGYPILTEHAAQLEQHAKNRALEECAEALDELKSICRRVVVQP